MALGPSGSWQGSGKGVESTNRRFHHQLSSTFFSNRRFKASDFNVLLLCGGCREDGAQKLEFSFFSTFDVRLRRGQDGIHVGNDNETSTMTTILHYGSSPSIASWRVWVFVGRQLIPLFLIVAWKERHWLLHICPGLS